MKKREATRDGSADRRQFLKGAALGGAVAVSSASAPSWGKDTQPPSAPAPTVPAAPRPDIAPPASQVAAAPDSSSGIAVSDHIVDILKSLKIEHVAFVPTTSTMGMHESIVNYGMLSEPRIELISCMHEETAVAMCHGYAKIAGKPMACMVDPTVGLQHASMAIYNAWADKAPVFAIIGCETDQSRREAAVGWAHSAYDPAALVRDFTKFDETPATFASVTSAALRAYRIAMTPPYGPALIAIDRRMQEDQIGGPAPAIPKLPEIVAPQGETDALDEVARMLVAAEHPVILADRCARTPQGLARLVALAEALQAPVCDSFGRFNFPWRHPLNQSTNTQSLLRQADVVLGLEMSDFYGVTEGLIPRSAKRVSISSSDLFQKANYQNFSPYTAVDIAIAADAEASLPSLTEAVLKTRTADQAKAFAARGARLAETHRRDLERSREAAAVGWDISPITTARLCMELYAKIRNEDWSLVNGAIFQNFWPQKLWSADKHHQYIGDSGAYGLGYLPGAALGAALANKSHGRLTVAIGGDGDLMFSPHVFWTAAHHKIPLLYIVHNNGGYHNEIMALQQIATRRNRGIDRCNIGTTLENPAISYAKLAESMGVYAEGPIRDPGQLAGAFGRAIAVVKSGAPALLDVITQGR